MHLPHHIVERVEAWVRDMPKASFHSDHEAAKYGGISLMGTIGGIWLMRPDGTFWEVDDDFGLPLKQLEKDLHIIALSIGARRHPWLAELLPRRPPNASDCSICKGSGVFNNGAAYCAHCQALGWISPSA